jgi:hypothetical protein
MISLLTIAAAALALTPASARELQNSLSAFLQSNDILGDESALGLWV